MNSEKPKGTAGLQSKFSGNSNPKDWTIKLDYLAKNPDAITIMDDLAANQAFVTQAIARNFRCYQYLPEEIKIIRWAVDAFFLALEKINYYADAAELIKLVSQDVDGYAEGLAKVIARHPDIIEYIDVPQQADVNYTSCAIAAVKEDVHLIAKISSEYPDYEQIAEAAIRADANGIEHVDSEHPSFQRLALLAIDLHQASNKNISTVYYQDYQLFKAALAACPDGIVRVEYSEDVKELIDVLVQYCTELKKLPNFDSAAFQALLINSDTLTNKLLEAAAEMSDAEATQVIDVLAACGAGDITLVFQFLDDDDTYTDYYLQSGIFSGVDLDNDVITRALAASVRTQLQERLIELKQTKLTSEINTPAPSAERAGPHSSMS
ncbi:MAG: hypothetical protein L6Q57_05610 [Alphaproteobacteria bacterium]|nr:hypothetical protein [Alphaproteobacteria bacterium]